MSMGTNFAGLQPGQYDQEALSETFAALSLRCVECATLYPARKRSRATAAIVAVCWMWKPYFSIPGRTKFRCEKDIAR